MIFVLISYNYKDDVVTDRLSNDRPLRATDAATADYGATGDDAATRYDEPAHDAARYAAAAYVPAVDRNAATYDHSATTNDATTAADHCLR